MIFYESKASTLMSRYKVRRVLNYRRKSYSVVIPTRETTDELVFIRDGLSSKSRRSFFKDP